MMNLRALTTGLALALAVTACKDKSKSEKLVPAVPGEAVDPAAAGDPGGAAAGSAAAGSAAADLILPASAITGRSVTPVVTRSITFAVPAAEGTWAEMSFPCYAAGITMANDGTRPRDPFEQVSPVIPAAMSAAGVDLDRDVAAIGGFACGEEPCLYFAVRLAKPQKVASALAVIPGVDVEDHGDHHYSFAVPGAPEPRHVHVRVVPIKWGGGTAPADPWTEWQTRASHLVFVHGMPAGEKEVDPVTLLAAPDAAAARVAATESVVKDTGGRCVIGTVGKSEFKPGFELTSARFAMAAPAGHSDPLTRLVDSERTLDVEIELTLDPAPTRKDVDRWIAESKQWLAEMAAPIRMQLAGQGAAFDVMVELFALVAERGFAPNLNGPRLTLSWRTDRIGQADLDQVESRLQTLMQ